MYRCATFLVIGASAVFAVGLLSGCGSSSRSVLYSGVSLTGGPKRVVTDAAAVRDVRAVHAQWLAEITGRAGEDPSQPFANLSAQQLRLRLAKAAARYHFTVKKVQLLHPRQVAPVIIVQTRRYLAFAHAVPAIAKALDPHTGGNDTAGWAFEAFFLEAQDERGVPFLDVFNFERGSGPGGGQWARSDQLYPFAHG
jgi:hypothetical protein